MKSFTAELAKLNPAQKEAVETIEGPVMVIAGPGTGKTQTLALRVANILKKTQVNPGNILCLTFSTAGAKAMRERLRKIIGSEAYSVNVNTVHGFCNNLILQYPQVFEDFKTLEQISEIERLRVVREEFNKLPAGSVLNRPVIDKDRAVDVLNRISELKREGILPEMLEPLIGQFRHEIGFTGKGKERDKTSQAYKIDLKSADQFTEFVFVYRGYLNALSQTHRYDYDDMVLTCLRAFKEHDWLLILQQEQYQYVLVDEFQDLNGAQNQLIRLLTEYINVDHDPNVFAVGDDDQAIYRFQGAHIGGMKEFIQRFKSLKLITLTESYRCPETVIKASGKLISKNTRRISGSVKGICKNLVSRTKENEEKKPEFIRFPDTLTEQAGIVEIIKNIRQEGVDWKEIVVLCNRNAEVLDLADVLQAAGVPAVAAARQDMLAHPQVLQLVALLRAVQDINNDSLLSDALAADVIKVPMAKLGELWVNYRQYSRAEKNQENSLYSYMVKNQPALPEQIGKVLNLLQKLHYQRSVITLPDLLEKLMKESGLLPEKKEKAADPRLIAGLHTFYDYVKNRCYEQKNLTLVQLLSDLEQYLTEPHLKLEYELPHLVSDGVQLMTAHGAKGLEFEAVILAHVRYSNWDNRRGRGNLFLPEHLIFGRDKEEEKQAKLEDERRLMYVAMTRAKKRLIMTFAEKYRSNDQLRDAQVSEFIADIGDGIKEIKLAADKIPAPIAVIPARKINIDDSFRAFLLQRLAEFELSVTALNAFLKDPQEFMWVHLMLQPQAKAPHLAYGTAVHKALEERNIQLKDGKNMDSENTIKKFEQYIQEKELFTVSERDKYLYMGRDVLSRYVRLVALEKPIVLSAEKTIKAGLGDIPLTGKVDRIDLFETDGRQCRIIDYKTGVPLKTETAVRKKEDYFRQLVFYKLLCDLSPSFIHEATLFTFDFVGNAKEDRRVIDIGITEREAQDLKDLIVKVWEKISSLDFTPLEA